MKPFHGGPFRFTVPLEGGELRITREGGEIEIQHWAVYPGREMMRGGVILPAAALRLVLHGLKYTLWDLERAELPPRDRAA